MALILQVRRADSTTRLAYTPADGEEFWDTTTQQMFVGDGATPGGILVGTGGLTQLTGDVTAGPGTGSHAATIANSAVTYAKVQHGASDGLLGVNNGAAPSEVAIGSGLTLTGGTLSASGGGGGAMALISTIDVTGTNVAAWTGLALGTFYLVGESLLPASGSNTITLEVGTGSTPTYDTTAGNYDLLVILNATNATTPAGAGGSNTLWAMGGLDSATLNFDATIIDADLFSRWTRVNGGVFQALDLKGRWKGTLANLTAFRAILTTGNFTSGKFSLYQLTR